MEKIIDKIRKLHAHAESAKNIGSEAEAQAFAQMVNRLLNQHRLELTDIQFEEQRKNEPVTQAEIDFRRYGDTYRGKKTEWKQKRQRTEWIERLADIVARAHSCQILIVENSNRLFLAGTETNRQIAEYVLITLMRAAEKISWDEYAKYFYQCRDEGDVTRARGFRHAWLISFIHRIGERFQEEKAKMNQDKTGTALVRYDRERMDIEEFLKNAKRAKALPMKAIHNSAGVIAGRKKADEMNLDANAVRDGGKVTREIEEKLVEVAVIEPVGKNKDQETIYELRQWQSSKIYCRGPLHSVFEQAERMWPRHARRQTETGGKYKVLKEQN